MIGAGMRVGDMVDIAKLAESQNFGTVAIAEAWRSGWVPLTAMAAATSKIRLAPYVLNAYGRSPLLTGMSAIDFNDFSNGRLVLGVGGGNKTINEVWQGIEHKRVLTKMREYVSVLQQMARTNLGETLEFSGQLHEMTWSPAIMPHTDPFPVYLAAVFPKMLKVASSVADGIAGGATLSPSYLADTIKPLAREYAEQADRDFAKLKWSAVTVFAMDADIDAARRAAREAICHFYAPLPHPYYEFTMREQGFGKIADALLELMPSGQVDAAMDSISDECLDTITICGTPAQCREKISSYRGLLDDLLLLNVMPSPEDDPIASYRDLFNELDGQEI